MSEREHLDYPEQMARHGKTLSIDFFYPRNDDTFDYIEVGLIDVRAADSIRIQEPSDE